MFRREANILLQVPPSKILKSRIEQYSNKMNQIYLLHLYRVYMLRIQIEVIVTGDFDISASGSGTNGGGLQQNARGYALPVKRGFTNTSIFFICLQAMASKYSSTITQCLRVANQPISTSQDHRIRRSPFWNGGFVPRSKIAVSNLFCQEGKLSTAESPRVMYLVRKAIPSIYFCHRYFGCRGKCDGGKHMACMCAATGHVISSLAESCMRS